MPILPLIFPELCLAPKYAFLHKNNVYKKLSHNYFQFVDRQNIEKTANCFSSFSFLPATVSDYMMMLTRRMRERRFEQVRPFGTVRDPQSCSRCSRRPAAFDTTAYSCWFHVSQPPATRCAQILATRQRK